MKYNGKEITTGEFIRTRRLEMELSSADLANILGIDRVAMYEIEQNLKPFPDGRGIFFALMAALKIKLGDPLLVELILSIQSDQQVDPNIYEQRAKQNDKRRN